MKHRDANQGIQGSVVADVVAVGYRAQATKTAFNVPDKERLSKLISHYENAIEMLETTSDAKKALRADASRLKLLASKEQIEPEKISNMLESIVGKVKILGTLTSGAAALVGPLEKIAAFLHLPAILTGVL